MHVLGISTTHTSWGNQCTWALTKTKVSTTCVHGKIGESGVSTNILDIGTDRVMNFKAL